MSFEACDTCGAEVDIMWYCVDCGSEVCQKCTSRAFEWPYCPDCFETLVSKLDSMDNDDFDRLVTK